jgi:hypothetical protein
MAGDLGVNDDSWGRFAAVAAAAIGRLEHVFFDAGGVADDHHAIADLLRRNLVL